MVTVFKRLLIDFVRLSKYLFKLLRFVKTGGDKTVAIKVD
jgi:hypothetical protein